MSFDGTYARMEIASAKTEMSGSYKCTISNEFGKEETSAQVSITSMLLLQSLTINC